jgi:glycine dehydrogenase subunit 2
MSTTVFRQSKWAEPLIFEMSVEGKVGSLIPEVEEEIRDIVGDVEKLVPEALLRTELPQLPRVSEAEVVGHFIRLSQMNYGVNSGRLYPLGSCTMKYNPVINEQLVSNPRLLSAHPYQDVSTVQGILEILYQLKVWLMELTGMDDMSLQPSAGAHGEYVGNLIIRAHHESRGELGKRTEMIVPDSAHGTNPSSAQMAGFSIVTVPSGEDGCIDLGALKEAVSDRTAGLMLTNPNTLGIFESSIREVSEVIHEAGGILYYDGANLNALLGKCRPGDMGFDIIHINLHKTFSTPHGGGGPGSGPVGVKKFLADFLPVPVVVNVGEHYALDYGRPHTIGRVRSFYGNTSVMVRAFAYMLSLGFEGLREASELAVLSSNYLARKLSKVRGFSLPFAQGKPRKHEFVLSASKMTKETKVRALDVAKKILDYGVHAPTVYFPLIVEEALMIEPTETVSLEDLDRFVKIFNEISAMAYSRPEEVMEAPRNTAVGRLDEVRAAHPKTFCPSWRRYKSLEERKRDEQ